MCSQKRCDLKKSHLFSYLIPMKLKIADFTFVILQFLLFWAYLYEIPIIQFEIPYSFKPIGIISIGIGCLLLLIAVLQLNKNLSPFPTPKSGSELITSGLYKYIRHPIYSGILGVLFGYAIYSKGGDKLIVFLLLYLLFFLKSLYEEKRLTLIFENYQDYKKKTGRFLPKINF